MVISLNLVEGSERLIDILPGMCLVSVLRFLNCLSYQEQHPIAVTIDKNQRQNLFAVEILPRGRNQGLQGLSLAAEYGKWKHWYRGDWLTGIYRTRELLQVFSKFLDDPDTHIAPPVLWDGWEAYYHIMHSEGDRSATVK